MKPTSISRACLLLLLLCCIPIARASAGSWTDHYVGAKTCASCHQSQYQQWLTSDHKKAMARATDRTVLGDFRHAKFTYLGVTSTFFRKGKQFWVRTDNGHGKLKDYRISYTFGVYPLQQYLVDFPDDRKQVLNIAWDSRPTKDGGQRWYQLLPDNPAMNHGDGVHGPKTTRPLPWTGIYYNWNSRCASCHSTHLVKGYNAKTNTYHTTWKAINVSCESCHGPGGRHVEWAHAKNKSGYKNMGLTVSLVNTSQWAFRGNKPPFSDIKHRISPFNRMQPQVCAHCHSRRQEMTQWQAGKPFADQQVMRLLAPGLYHADGQMISEVYVYGSFLQSKMHQNGVVCSDCHNPHTLKLKFPGNRTCTQCHKASVFNTPKHFHHPVGSPGGKCINCHMPRVTYMGVDARYSHAFRLPRPMMDQKIGSPDVCLGCHQGRSNTWAQKTIDGWGLPKPQPADAAYFANAFYPIDHGQARNSKALVKVAQNRSLPAIVRGSAAMRLGNVPDQGAIKALAGLLDSSSWLIRLGAVRAISNLPLRQCWQLLKPHLHDPVRAVRFALSKQLSGIPLQQVSKADRTQLKVLFSEFLDSLDFNAGMPASRVTAGVFETQRGNLAAAQKDYQTALKLAPDYEGALLNLADLYRQTHHDKRAKPLLMKAVRLYPDSAPAHYVLGLWWVRHHDTRQALKSIQAAHQLQPQDPQYVLVNALLLQRLKRPSEAIDLITHWQKRYGPIPQLQNLLRQLQSG